MRAIFDIYEQTLRLLSIVGLAEAAQHGIGLPGQLITRLGRPSVGTWYEASLHLYKQLPEGACSRMFWGALEESPIDNIISTRNDVAHGSEFGDLKAADWLSSHDPALRVWVTRLAQRFPFRLFAVHSSAFDGTNLVHRTVALEGGNSVLPKREVTTKGNLVLHPTHLQSVEGATVPLYPLLLAEHGAALNSCDWPRVDRAAHARMPARSWPERSSQQRLQIRSQDILNAAHSSGFQDSRGRSLLAAEAVTEGFQSHIQAYLVPVLEAIGDCLRYGCYAHWYTFNDAVFLTVLERSTGETNHTKRWRF